MPALRAGGRYVWHEPVVRRILLRTALFITPGMALWALLPDRHSALGPRSRRLRRSVRCAGTRRHHRRPDTGAGEGPPVNQWDAQCSWRPLRGSTGRHRPGPQFPGSPSDIGFRWTGLDHSHLDAERRTAAFPAGLGPRPGLAVYMVNFTGSMTVGALVWGLVAEGGGLLITFLIAAVVMLAGVVAGVVWKVPETGHLDREPAIYWPEPRMAFDPELDSGPVLVSCHRHAGTRDSFPRSDEPPPPVSTPHRSDPLGALPRRRPTRPLHRALQRRLLGGTPAPARGPLDRGGQRGRGGCAGFFGSACPGGTPAAAVANRA